MFKYSSGKVFIFVVFGKLQSHSVLLLFPYYGSWARKENTREKPGVKSAKPWEKILKYEQIMIALFLLEVFTDILTTK